MRVSCTPLTPRRLLWRWRTVGHFRYIFSFKVCKWVRCFAECCCKCGLTILLCSQIIWDWRPGSSEKGSPKRGSVRVYCFSGARHKGLACLRSSQEKATGSSVVAATSWPSNCAGTSYLSGNWRLCCTNTTLFVIIRFAKFPFGRQRVSWY